MGKPRKIDTTKKRETKEKRAVTFTKRRRGLFNKAAELCTLCDAQVGVVVKSPSNVPKHKYYSFGHSSVDAVLGAYLEGRLPGPVDDNLKRSAMSMSTEISGLEIEQQKQQHHRKRKPVIEGGGCPCRMLVDEFQKSESVEELRELGDSILKLKEAAQFRLLNDPGTSSVAATSTTKYEASASITNNDNVAEDTADFIIQYAVNDDNFGAHAVSVANAAGELTDHFVDWGNATSCFPNHAMNGSLDVLQDGCWSLNYDNNAAPLHCSTENASDAFNCLQTWFFLPSQATMEMEDLFVNADG